MSYGLEVLNQNGFIQFNSTSYANRVIASGTASVFNKVVAGYPSNYNLRYFTVNGHIIGPQRRLWMKSQSLNQYMMASYGGDYDASTDTTLIRVEDSVPVGSLFDYVLTDYGGSDSNTGYGLVVKNPSGGVEFNSSDQQVMITSTWSYDVYEGLQSEWKTEYYGFARIDYKIVDVNISSAPYGGRPYIFADGMIGGCINNTSGFGDTWLTYSHYLYLNDTTVRVKIQRIGMTASASTPRPSYHRFTLITGVLR